MEGKKVISGRDMTVGREWKLILSFALPIILGSLLQQLYSTVDGVVVGRMVDSDALSAVGNCTTVASFFLAFSLGFSGGCGVVLSHYYGGKRFDDLRRMFATGMAIALGLGAVFSILGAVGSVWLLEVVLNIRDARILEYAKLYLSIYCVGLIFTFLYNYIAYALRAIGDSRATLYFLALASLLNIGLDVIFVGMYGILGAAVATVVAQIICAIVSYVYMIKRYEMLRLKWREFKPDREMTWMCIRLGIPAVMQQCSVSLGQTVMQRLVNSFGSTTIAAYVVGAKVERYLSAPILGVQQSMSTFTGQNLGANREERVKKGLRGSLAITLIMAALLGGIVYIAAAPTVALFGVEGETMRQAIEYIRFVMPGCMLIFAVYQSYAGLLHGAGDVGFVTFISLSSLAARAVYSYIRVYVFEAEYPILWRSLLLAYLWSLIFACVRYYRGTWKKKSEVLKNRVDDAPN
ncbi:MAG: MATE family efflux transporter [Clostridiales bacterium]|nr:MATE family efflux transporter [Clostridiales bacterium]